MNEIRPQIALMDLHSQMIVARLQPILVA